MCHKTRNCVYKQERNIEDRLQQLYVANAAIDEEVICTVRKYGAMRKIRTSKMKYI